jgi:hypothetical protein
MTKTQKMQVQVQVQEQAKVLLHSELVLPCPALSIKLAKALLPCETEQLPGSPPSNAEYYRNVHAKVAGLSFARATAVVLVEYQKRPTFLPVDSLVPFFLPETFPAEPSPRPRPRPRLGP